MLVKRADKPNSPSSQRIWCLDFFILWFIASWFLLSTIWVDFREFNIFSETYALLIISSNNLPNRDTYTTTKAWGLWNTIKRFDQKLSWLYILVYFNHNAHFLLKVSSLQYCALIWINIWSPNFVGDLFNKFILLRLASSSILYIQFTWGFDFFSRISHPPI